MDWTVKSARRSDLKKRRPTSPYGSLASSVKIDTGISTRVPVLGISKLCQSAPSAGEVNKAKTIGRADEKRNKYIEEGGGKRRPLNEKVIRANCSRWYAARRPVVLVVKTTSSLGCIQLGESAVDVLDASNQMKRSRVVDITVLFTDIPTAWTV